MNNGGMPGVIAFHAWELLKFYQKHEHEVCANCPVDKDYVEVVRCKDCKQGHQLDNSNYYVCGKPFSENREAHTEDWFCADGEQR